MNAQALGKRDVHLKILGVQESDISKFHTEDLQIRGTVQTIVATATRHPTFVHPCSKRSHDIPRQGMF